MRYSLSNERGRAYLVLNINFSKFTYKFKVAHETRQGGPYSSRAELIDAVDKALHKWLRDLWNTAAPHYKREDVALPTAIGNLRETFLAMTSTAQYDLDKDAVVEVAPLHLTEVHR